MGHRRAAVVGIGQNMWGLAIVLLGVVELALAVLTFLFVQEGPVARSREGRPWRAIAREAWGTDVLRERSFLRMTGVRFLFRVTLRRDDRVAEVRHLTLPLVLAPEEFKRTLRLTEPSLDHHPQLTRIALNLGLDPGPPRQR